MGRWLGALGVLVGLGLLEANAATCPVNLQQDNKGYWTSNDPPGWKSYQPTDSTVTLAAKDFSGAVYSPAKKRIACVYKASDGKWVVLLSSVYYPFQETDLKNAAWKFNPKHKDYICEPPSNQEQALKSCQFDVKNNESRRKEETIKLFPQRA